MAQQLPTAVGIGFRRCGSSWLQACLNDHPEISKRPEGGQHFFSDHFEKGVEWYSSELSSLPKRKCLIDFSVSYSYPEKYKQVVSRLKMTLPDAKLFAVVRNPIDRAFSDYKRGIARLEIPANRSFEDAILHEPALLERGLYGKVLSNFVEEFGREKVFILFYEDLERDPESFLRPLLEFLNLNSNVSIDFNDKIRNRAKKIRFSVYHSFFLGAKNLSDHIISIFGLEAAWGRLKQKHLRKYQKILSWNELDADLKKNTKVKLLEFYAEDIELVESISGRSLKAWKSV